MSHFRHDALRKRQSLGSLSGSLVVSTTPTATALAQDNSVTSISDSYTGIPLAQSTPSLTSSSTPSAAVTSSTSSSPDNISLSAVIGACVGAFILFVLVICFAIYCFRQQKPQQRASRNATHSRRRSRVGSWNRLKDGGDHKQSDELPMQRPPSGPMEKLDAMFHRTPSLHSGEKSYETYGNRESIGTMQHFAKYHPGLAEEMASKPNHVGLVVARPPPVRQLGGRTHVGAPPAISWDSETLGGDSFLSMHSHLSGTMTPTAAIEKFTPPATASGSHRWESAEIGHMDLDGSEISEAADARSPFADSNAASTKTSLSRRVTNPFFNAQEKPQKRPFLATTPTHDPNPFSDSNAAATRSSLDARSETVGGVNSTPNNNTQAMQSLLAALNMVPQDRLSASMQSSHYSFSSTVMSDVEDVVSVTAFPYPPT